MIRRFLIIFLLFIGCGSAVAQEFEESLTLYFRNSDGEYDPEFRSNGKNAAEFFEKIQTYQRLPGVRITGIVSQGTTSPEGSASFNNRLAEKRRMSFKKELHANLDFPDFKIETESNPDWCQGTIALVEQDPNIIRKDEVMEIIGNKDANMVQQLIALDKGVTYRYIEQVIFPELRTCRLKVYLDFSEYVAEAEIPDDQEVIESLTYYEDGLDFVEYIWPERVPFLEVDSFMGEKFTVAAKEIPKKYVRQMKRRLKRRYDNDNFPARYLAPVILPPPAIDQPAPEEVTMSAEVVEIPYETATSQEVAMYQDVTSVTATEAQPVKTKETQPVKTYVPTYTPEPEKKSVTQKAAEPVREPEVRIPSSEERQSDTEQPERLMSIKSNIAGLAFSVANLAFEFDLGDHISLNIPFYYSGWDYAVTRNMFKGLIVQPELRYYPTERKRLFANVHVGAAWYNLTYGGDYRYQNTGWARPTYGGGIGIGYRVNLGKDSGWKMEFALGGGVYDAEYDRFFNEENGPFAARKDRFLYLGFDQAAITLTYSFNMRRGGRR